MPRTFLPSLAILSLAMAVTACSTAPRSPGERENLIERAEQTRETFLHADPSLEQLFEEEHAYAIFPAIGRGGVGVGGAYGRGVVFQDGEVIGFCDVSQGDIGFQLGGQSYSQLMFFRDQPALDRFKYGELELSARASAVAATQGASTEAEYSQGVMVFLHTRGGLMYEASVGGQRFTYTPR